MRDAAVFLVTRSLGNWGRRILPRFRSPRYVLAVLLGLGYLALVRFGQTHGASGAVPTAALETGGTLLLAVMAAKWWLFGADRLALAFSPAEIQFFFPAPVSRADLLGFKLLRAQRLILVNVLVWTFLLRPSGAGGPGAVPYAISVWVFFMTLFLHRLGVALTRDTMVDHGRAGLRHAWPAAAVLLLVVAAVWQSVSRLPADSLAHHPGGLLGALRTLVATAPLGWLLSPFRIPALPLGATGPAEWWPRLLGAGLFLGIHWYWVIRADWGFEEAAIEASRRREALLRSWRRQGGSSHQTAASRRWRWRLSASGHPATAIMWKNVTRLVRTIRPAALLLILLSLIAGLGLGIAQRDLFPGTLIGIGILTLGWTGALGILGSQWVRCDLRGDISHLPLLRTWPVSGTTLVTGQVLGSAFVLSCLQLTLGSTGLIALSLSGELDYPPGLILVTGVGAILVLGGLNLVSLCVQNGGAILFPSWVRTDLRPGGIEQAGLQLLSAGITLALMVLAALGPAVLGAATAYLLWPGMGLWVTGPVALIATLGLGLEAFLLLDWLGDRFQRLDVSSLA